MLVMNPHSEYAQANFKLPAFLFQYPQTVKMDYTLASSDVEQIAVKDVHQKVDPKE
jgi:hypothetical protein